MVSSLQGSPRDPVSWHSQAQVQSIPSCIRVGHVTSRLWHKRWMVVTSEGPCVLSLGSAALGETSCPVGGEAPGRGAEALSPAHSMRVSSETALISSQVAQPWLHSETANQNHPARPDRSVF